MMSFAEKKAGTREALLSSAEQLFTEKEYAAVSTRELAEHANVNLGAIQYHFGSKAQLFIETVRCLMRRRHEGQRLFCSCDVAITSKEDAAAALCIFIRSLMDDLCHTQGPDICRIMQRETAGATSKDPEMFEALVSTITNEFISPMDDRLLAIIRLICPKASERESQTLVQSVIGQCSYYVTHRPFTERLRGLDFTSEPTTTEVGEYITTFTLRGLGLSESEIAAAKAKASASCTKEKGK